MADSSYPQITGTITPTPRNPLLGSVSDNLARTRSLMNLPGAPIGDWMIAGAPEEVNRWAYGDYPVQATAGQPLVKRDRLGGLLDAGSLAAAVSPTARGLLAAGLEHTVPSGAGLATRADQLGAITPEGRAKLIQALRDRSVNGPFQVGTLEPAALQTMNEERAARGWAPFAGDSVAFGPRDLQHMLKRVDQQGVSPEDMGRMAESVLAPDAVATTTPMAGRINLTGARILDVPPGGPTTARGAINSRRSSNAPTLYGLYPDPDWPGWRPQK